MIKIPLRLLSLLILLSLSLFCKKMPDYPEPINVSNNPGRAFYSSIAVDSKGTVHIVWVEDRVRGDGKEEIMYIYKLRRDTFSKPVILSERGRFHSLIVDKDDNVHLAWQEFIGFGWVICYRFRPPLGEWSEPETVSTTFSDVDPNLAADRDGNLYMIWVAGGYYPYLFFSMKEKGGSWTIPERITPRGAICYKGIEVDRLRNAHIVVEYSPPDSFIYEIHHIIRDRFGNWSRPSILPDGGKGESCSGLSITSDQEGNIHMVFHRWNKDIYTFKPLGGDWSKPEYPPHRTYGPNDIKVDNSGTVYILPTAASSAPSLIKREKGGKWSKVIPVLRSSVPGAVEFPKMAIYNDEIHIVWAGGGYEKENIYYVAIKKP